MLFTQRETASSYGDDDDDGAQNIKSLKDLFSSICKRSQISNRFVYRHHRHHHHENSIITLRRNSFPTDLMNGFILEQKKFFFNIFTDRKDVGSNGGGREMEFIAKCI